MMQEQFIGVDVAKDWLDIHHAHQKPYQVTNSPTAILRFITACRREGAWVTFEATAGSASAKNTSQNSSPWKWSSPKPRAGQKRCLVSDLLLQPR
jgi:transposase